MIKVLTSKVFIDEYKTRNILEMIQEDDKEHWLSESAVIPKFTEIKVKLGHGFPLQLIKYFQI